MAETITVSLDVRLASGPAWTASRQVVVDAIDVVDVVIPQGAVDTEVPIQPGGTVRLLLVMADPPTSEVTYSTSSGSADNYQLDEPHLLVGEGALSLLGATAPTSLFFTKIGTNDARVRILVGRDVA